MTDAHADPKPRSLDATIGAIAALLSQPHAAGLAADLRRMAPGDVACSAFWKISVRHLHLEGSEERVAEQERRWSVILASLAAMADRHRTRVPLGAALARADLSEARVLKLLRARGTALPDVIRTVCHQLGAASQPVDFADIARLVLSEGRRDEERVRRRIARAYYRSTGGNP